MTADAKTENSRECDGGISAGCGLGDADPFRLGKYFRHMLKSSPEMMIFADRDGRIAYCTDTLLRLAKIADFGEVYGKPFQRLYAKFGGDDFVRRGELRFELVKNSLSTVSSEVRIDFAGDGEGRIYNVQASPMLDSDGAFDGIIVTYYDTTDVRDIEADEYTRIMLDATPLACSLWDEDDNLLSCNQEALRMFGLSRQSDYTRCLTALSPAFQPDGARSAAAARANDNMAIEKGYNRFEWMHKTLDGEPLPVETTLVRVPWKGGFRLATYSRDLRNITQTRKMAEEAGAKNRDLEERMRAARVASEAKSRFFASISHEIRTPMNAIIGMSDLFQTDNLDMTQKGYLEDIRKMSKSLLQIVNDVLDFSQMEAGRLEINPVNFDLKEMYDNICSMCRFLADSKGLYFTGSFDPGAPRVLYGDDLRMRQAIINIVNNSIKYTREGGVTLEVGRVSKAGDDSRGIGGGDAPVNGRDAPESFREYISFRIRDTGIGIREEDMPKLFEAFYQVDMAVNRGISGSGLGLPITKNLVTLMGGDIEIESAYGSGTVFTVFFPLIEGDAAQLDAPQSDGLTIFSDDARVLVTDDSRINLKVAAAYLERLNIRAETALSGAEAVVKIRKTPGYDLVFMDHMMPDMDGLETSRRIRSLGYDALPIIALTANAFDGIRELYLSAGMNDYISKPINPYELNKVLTRWLPAKIKRGGGTAPAGDKNDVGAAEADAGFIMNFDVETGISNAAGDEQFFLRLLSDFIADHGNDHRKILDAINAGDAREAIRLAHTLKGAAALIGANRLRQVAFSVETLLGEGESGKAIKALNRLDAELTAVIDAIEKIAK